jgi:hypothetical protein
MSCVILIGWRYCCSEGHAPTEDKNDDMKESFYEELECVFDLFLKYHLKILLGDFSVKVEGEDIFQSNNHE